MSRANTNSGSLSSPDNWTEARTCSKLTSLASFAGRLPYRERRRTRAPMTLAREEAISFLASTRKKFDNQTETTSTPILRTVHSPHQEATLLGATSQDALSQISIEHQNPSRTGHCLNRSYASNANLVEIQSTIHAPSQSSEPRCNHVTSRHDRSQTSTTALMKRSRLAGLFDVRRGSISTTGERKYPENRRPSSSTKTSKNVLKKTFAIFKTLDRPEREGNLVYPEVSSTDTKESPQSSGHSISSGDLESPYSVPDEEEESECEDDTAPLAKIVMSAKTSRHVVSQTTNFILSAELSKRIGTSPEPSLCEFGNALLEPSVETDAVEIDCSGTLGRTDVPLGQPHVEPSTVTSEDSHCVESFTNRQDFGDVPQCAESRVKKCTLEAKLPNLLRRATPVLESGECCYERATEAFIYHKLEMVKGGLGNVSTRRRDVSGTSLANDEHFDYGAQTDTNNPFLDTSPVSGVRNVPSAISKRRFRPTVTSGSRRTSEGDEHAVEPTRTFSEAVVPLPGVVNRYLSSQMFDVVPEESPQNSMSVLSRNTDREASNPVNPVLSDEPVVGQHHPEKRLIITRKAIIWPAAIALVTAVIFGLIVMKVLPSKDVEAPVGGYHKISFSHIPSNATETTAKLQENHYDTCSSDFCLRDGSYIKGLLSWDLNPCDNFYQFVCGRWKSTIQRNVNYTGSPVTAQEDLVHILEDRVKTLLVQSSSHYEFEPLLNIFNECMDMKQTDTEDWNPMLDLLWLAMLDDFPFTSTPKNISVWQISGKVLRISGTETLLSVRKTINPFKNVAVLAVGHPTVLSPDAGNHAETTQFYNSTAYISLTALKKQRRPSKYSQEIANFAAELEALSYYRDVIPKQHVYKVVALKEYAELYSFMKYAYDGIGDDTEVMIDSTYFLDRLLNLVRQTEQYIVLNYIGVRLMLEASAFAPSVGHQLTDRLVHSIYKTQRPSLPRWKLCLRTAERAIPKLFAHASRLALQEDFKIDAIQRHLKALTEELSRSLDNVPTFDKSSRNQARKIINDTDFIIFYPLWLAEKEKLQDFLRRMPKISPGQGLLSFYTLRGHSAYEALQQGTEEQWVGSVFDTDCRYNGRTVYLPPLLFNLSLANAGGGEVFQLPHAGVRILRCVLHMLLHEVFADNATARVGWWPNLTSSFMKSYQVCLQEYDINPVGAAEMLETTAVMTPVLNVYKKARKTDVRLENFQGYGTTQLFFVYYALRFCKEHAIDNGTLISDASRNANVPLWNSKIFQETFRCPVGTGMNPANKCVVWREAT